MATKQKKNILLEDNNFQLWQWHTNENLFMVTIKNKKLKDYLGHKCIPVGIIGAYDADIPNNPTKDAIYVPLPPEKNLKGEQNYLIPLNMSDKEDALFSLEILADGLLEFEEAYAKAND